MQIRHVADYESLCALREAWDQLAGDMPMRCWDWHAAWWRYYGNHKQLLVLVVIDDAQQVQAIAPWFVEKVPARGRVVRPLGTGEICSDYQTILTRPETRQEAIEALAAWLLDQQREQSARWDLLELENILLDDPAQSLLCELLSEGEALVHRSPALQCWRLQLPVDWETYLSELSKSHRKQVRRFVNRVLETPRATVHTVQTVDEVTPAMDILIDLHQRRWESLGESGCFASPRFTAFHRHMAQVMQKRGQLRLHWVEVDGTPIAAEYHFAGSGDAPDSHAIYGYQAGVDPTRMDEEPGRLAAIATLQLAIAEGFNVFDFLRGDEPYKAHWRAEPLATCNVRIVPPRAAARVRDNLWQAGRRMKAWWQTSEKDAEPVTAEPEAAPPTSSPNT